MGKRHYCCRDKLKVKRGFWSAEEDAKLLKFILTNGTHHWSQVPKLAGLDRCGKSCRLRWINYLCPGLKKGPFTEEEENIVRQQHRMLGNKWSVIAKHVPGRTDNDVKNFWHTTIKKKIVDKDNQEENQRTNLHFFTNLLNVPDLSQFRLPPDLSQFKIPQPSADFLSLEMKKTNNWKNVVQPNSLQVPQSLDLSLRDPTDLIWYKEQNPEFFMDCSNSGSSSSSVKGKEKVDQVDEINGERDNQVIANGDDSLGFDHELVDGWWNASL